LLYYVHNVFLLLHVSLYFTFSTAVCTWKGALFPQVMVNISDHASVRDLSSMIFLLMFVNSSSGVTIAKPVHEMHIGILFVGK
jgi:hypothetical protein